MGDRLERPLDSGTGPWNPGESYGGCEAVAVIILSKSYFRSQSFADVAREDLTGR